MGLMGQVMGLGTAAREIGTAVGGVAEVFAGNRAQREAQDAERFQAVVAEQSAEFAQAPTGAFHGFVDGLNRLPRPMMALGTLSLFVYAMVEPLGFGLRMEGLQHVPEPLWWLLGAIVSFYFGAREFHYWRGGALPSVASARTVVETGGRVKAPVAEAEEDAPLSLGALRPKGRIAAADPYYNAALEEWRGRR
jgi:hypothetical protein